MRDPFGRDINYMRISITDRCNLRCRYCMPEDLPEIPHEVILRYEEILQVCEAAIGLGIVNFRVTGGEPLVRRGCVDFVRALTQLAGVGGVMLTTNGVLLQDHVPDLVDMGIEGVNISLDTLDRRLYQEMTGVDCLDRVYSGIEAAVAGGLQVKVNCVILRGVNEDSFIPVTRLARDHPLDVRFIEIMPIGAGAGFTHVPGRDLIALLSKEYPSISQTTERRGHGPAIYYAHESLLGRIGFIDAVSHGQCEDCNRIRLTSDGLLKTCLYEGAAIDLKPSLRGRGDRVDLAALIREAVMSKREKHVYGDASLETEQRRMSQIGG